MLFRSVVAERKGTVLYDISGVELGHHGEWCSFDAFLEKYKLTDPALQALARIVRGTDTDARQLTPKSAGLYALSTGFRGSSRTTWRSSSRRTTPSKPTADRWGHASK